MPACMNYYHYLKDSTEWADGWSGMCNDKCPNCNAEIEPYRSDEIDARSLMNLRCSIEGLINFEGRGNYMLEA
jgi:hypothetical protein